MHRSVRPLALLFGVVACSGKVLDDHGQTATSNVPGGTGSGGAATVTSMAPVAGGGSAPSVAAMSSGVGGSLPLAGGAGGFTFVPSGAPSGGASSDDLPIGSLHPPRPSGGDGGVAPPPNGAAGAGLAGDGGGSASPACSDRPELLVVPEAGTGTISGCPRRVCTGVPSAPEYSFTDTTDITPFIGCTEVTNSVVITGYTGTDLSSLHCLEHVGGDMVVQYSPTLVTLHGLESLTLVGGQLGIGFHGNQIATSDELVNIAALSGIRAVGGDFDIAGGDALENLAGLESLVAVGGHLMVAYTRHTGRQLDVSGMNSLVWIGQDLEFMDSKDVARATGFRALRTVGGGFYVFGATDMVELPKLPALECIRGTLEFGDTQMQDDDPLLKDIALPALRRIGGDVHVDHLNGLETLSLFETVEEVDGATISIAGNPELTSVPISALRSFQGALLATGDRLLDACPLHDFAMRLRASGWAGMEDFTGTPDCP